MENDKKNGEKNGETKFSPEYQPSPEAKSLGWQRRKIAIEFMNKVMEYQNLTISDFEKLKMKMKTDKNLYTIREYLALTYADKAFISDKFLIDWLDRHFGKVPSIEIYRDATENKLEKISVEYVS